MSCLRAESPADMQRRLHIVIVCPRIPGAFILQDERLLRSAFDVTLVSVTGFGSLSKLWAAIARADAVLIWFLGRHAIPAIILAKLRRIPIVSVIGGFEVAWISDIDYGLPPGSTREASLRWMLNQSRIILTVSQFSHDLAAARYPEFSNRLKLIHNAVDPDVFAYSIGKERSGILCVAGLSRGSIKVKNLGLLREVAIAMPEASFTLIGPAHDDAARQYIRSFPKNLHWRGQLPAETLASVYRAASVYIQLSRHESFSLALAEAMACGCIPVISGNGALPEVGGSVARTATPLSVASCREAIRSALLAGEEERRRAREHVLENFGTERRARLLISLFNSIVEPRSAN